jgi:hypothetical protein
MHAALATLGLIIGLLLSLAPVAVDAQTTTKDEIAITAQEAAPDFPNGITFTLNASSAEPITVAELYYRPARLEALRLGEPAFEPGTEVALSYEADFRGGRMPPGVDISYFWRLETASGAILETPEQVVLWADSRFDWQPLQGNLVTVYAYNNDPGHNQAILDSAERTIAELSQEYDAEMDEPIRIWAYSSGEDFVGALAPNSESWIAGAAYPQLGIIMSVLPPGNLDEVGRVVPHEVSHQVLSQATENPFNGPPVWLDEGLATQAQENGAERFPEFVMSAAVNGMLEPIPVLNSQFPYDAEGALLGYAQSESIVDFIADTYGDDAIARLIAVFREGVSYDEAVQRALGVTMEELDEQWQASVLQAAEAAGIGATDGDGSTGFPWFGGIDDMLMLASGTLIMGLVALLALVVGAVTIVRTRRRLAAGPEEPDDPIGNEPWRTRPEPVPVAPERRPHDLLSSV